MLTASRIRDDALAKAQALRHGYHSFSAIHIFTRVALRAFVWVIGVGRERVRVVVAAGKARVRDWWHAGTFVDDVQAAAPTGVPGRVSVSRRYAEPSRAEPSGAVLRGAGRRRGSPSGGPHPASPPTASPGTPWPSGLLKGSTPTSG